MKINIPENIKFVMEILNKNFESFVVGGCVRDSILNQPVHDWDITTSAYPDEIKKAFDLIPGVKILHTTGEKHGTVVLYIDNETIEVTTYRTESGYSDGRHPDSVNFVRNLEEDLKRRDLTINAMAYNDEAGLVDLFGGLDDLNNRIIRCVGNAEERYNEDALRMLRTIRFANRLSFSIDIDTLFAIAKCNDRLQIISVERIKEELTKILLCDRIKYYDVIAKLIEPWLPEWKISLNYDQKNPNHIYTLAEHAIIATESINDSNEDNKKILRWVMFLHDIGKPSVCTTDEKGICHYRNHGETSALIAERFMQNLKFDNDSSNRITILIKYHDAIWQAKKKNIKKLLNIIGVDNFKLLIKIRAADIIAQNQETLPKKMETLNISIKMLDEILTEEQAFSIKQLKINGNDIINIEANGKKLFKGPIVGKILNELLNKVIEEELINDHDVLIGFIKDNYI